MTFFSPPLLLFLELVYNEGQLINITGRLWEEGGGRGEGKGGKKRIRERMREGERDNGKGGDGRGKAREERKG